MERELPYPPRFLLDPIEIDDQLLHPGIRRDHAFTSRLFIICLAGLMGIASLLFFLSRFLSPPLVRGLSARFSELFGMRDRLWILSIGMLLPAGFTLATTRFPLFGLEYWGVDDSLPILPIAHLIATFLLVVGVSIVTARWRLAIRAPSFGFSKRVRWYEWVPVVSAVFYIPLIGWRMQTHEPTPKELCLWAIPLVPMLAWISTFVARASLGDFRECLANAAVTRGLIPICGWTFVSLLLFSHLLKIEENRWHRKYTWNSFTPESRGATQAEAFLAKHVLLELRQALDFQP